MVKLIDKLTSSYNNTALIEKHRVFPYILSAVNKILSRIFPASISSSSTAAASDFSSLSTDDPVSISASSSKLILSVLQCFHQSLQGLSEDNLDISISDFNKPDHTAPSINAATFLKNDDSINNKTFHENCNHHGIDKTINTNIHNENRGNNISNMITGDINNNEDHIENVSIYYKQNNKENNDDDKEKEKADDNRNYDVKYKNNLDNGGLACVDEMPLQLLEDSFSLSEAIIVFSNTEIIMSKIVFLLTMCMENVKLREIENTKTSSNRSVVIKIDDQKNNNHSNTNNLKKNDDARIIKKELNADDDDIISECFKSLQISQLYWTLLNIKKNKDTESGIKAEVEFTEKKESKILAPFSGFYLAQFIQFSLYFSTSR